MSSLDIFLLFGQDIIESSFTKQTMINVFQIGMIYKTYISICLVSDESEPILKKYKTKRYQTSF